jgi:membrane-anchored glycerophosphoryl diester phosphodiesterase (GDPDase)
MSVLLALIFPVIAVEEAGPAAALSRSWSLTRRRFWPYLGTLIVITIVSTIAQLIVSGTLGGLQYAADALFPPLNYILIAIDNIASNLVTLPIMTTGAVLLYFDARIRFEGLDLQVAAAQLEQDSQAEKVSKPPEAPVNPPQQS